MGEIADDMISGFSCSWCGVYFEKEHGHPVACHDCYNDFAEDVGISKAYHKELGED